MGLLAFPAPGAPRGAGEGAGKVVAKVLRVLPSGRTVPHIQGFFNFTETRLATAGKS